MKRNYKVFLSSVITLTFILTGCASATPNGESSNTDSVQTTSSSKTSSSENESSSSSTNGSSSSNNESPNIPESSDPVVFFTSDISPKGLMSVYEALGVNLSGKVAVKLSTGEPPASNYLRPELIKDLVQSVDGTIVECNTAYGGSRAQTAMHYQVAKDHGFTDIANFQILDENGSMTLPVSGGSVLKENYVGKAFADYDSYLILSHFKGHSMAGFGGAIKNISIGLGSSEGKAWIHSGGTSKKNAWGGKQDAFLEAMAEAGKSVADYLGNGERIVYVNVMNRLSVDCDCDGHPAEPDMHDIGILASIDPVALDQACIDLIYAQKDAEGASLVSRIESKNGLHTLEHAADIGLGSRAYKLVNINNTDNEKTPANSGISDAAENVRAIITINGKEYGMTITDTTIGRAFAKKLRDEGVYTVTGYRSTDDLCCSESGSLETDPKENMPWECGGVAWTGSWFTIWVSRNAADHDMPIIAKIDEEYSKELQALSGNMKIEVRLAA